MTIATAPPPLAAEIDAKVAQFGQIADALVGKLVDVEGYEVDALEALRQAALDVVVTRAVRVLLCCGGPHVEAVAILDADGEVAEARVIGASAGERIERRLTAGEPAWQALQAYAEAIA